MYTALNIASAVIKRCDEMGRPITNLKLQKVLYYIQISALKQTETVAFEDDIEAWRHGPVVRNVYNKYKRFISSPIESDDPVVQENMLVTPLSDVMPIIDDIVTRTIELGAWELVALTHETSPWKGSYRPGFNRVIPISSLREGEVNI